MAGPAPVPPPELRTPPQGPTPEPSESKGDGETWEDYAHRLEARIKEQRAGIKNLTDLRNVPGDIQARKRIANLERLLGKKELALSKQHDGLHAQKIAHAELREAVLAVADGTLADPCWCGDEWWEVHDAHAGAPEHSEWCLRLRALVLTERSGFEVFTQRGQPHRPSFDHEEAAQRFLDGANVRELAAHYGVSERVFRQAIRRRGVNVRERTRG